MVLKRFASFLLTLMFVFGFMLFAACGDREKVGDMDLFPDSSETGDNVSKDDGSGSDIQSGSSNDSDSSDASSDSTGDGTSSDNTSGDTSSDNTSGDTSSDNTSGDTSSDITGSNTSSDGNSSQGSSSTPDVTSSGIDYNDPNVWTSPVMP